MGASWQGFVGGAVDCRLCGAVEETVAHFVTECVVLEGVREQFGVTREEVLEVGGDIAHQREDTGEGEEEHRVVGGDVEKEKKGNGPTSAGTGT